MNINILKEKIVKEERKMCTDTIISNLECLSEYIDKDDCLGVDCKRDIVSDAISAIKELVKMVEEKESNIYLTGRERGKLDGMIDRWKMEIEKQYNARNVLKYDKFDINIDEFSKIIDELKFLRDKSIMISKNKEYIALSNDEYENLMAMIKNYDVDLNNQKGIPGQCQYRTSFKNMENIIDELKLFSNKVVKEEKEEVKNCATCVYNFLTCGHLVHFGACSGWCKQ